MSRLATARRLLIALDDLTAQAAASLRAGEIAAALAIGERIGPLLADMAGRATELDDPRSQALIARVRARIRVSDAWVSAERRRIATELENIRAGQRRMGAIAPAYGRAARSGGSVRMVG